MGETEGKGDGEVSISKDGGGGKVLVNVGPIGAISIFTVNDGDAEGDCWI